MDGGWHCVAWYLMDIASNIVKAQVDLSTILLVRMQAPIVLFMNTQEKSLV